MHSGQTADPLNRYSKALKAVSSKRAKTDADFEEMAKIEWYASLYTNKKEKIIIPDFVLEAAFVAGARKSKLGKQAQAGLFVDGHALLNFDGDDLPIDELFKRDQNRHCAAVRVQRARVMRTRSFFEDWTATIKLVYNDSMLNKPAVIRAIEDCGEQVGLCDWRPKYGRFVVETIQ
ncbi:hypothetical protein SPB21_03700 [Leptothoe sp. ISB3NOV94-8A]